MDKHTVRALLTDLHNALEGSENLSTEDRESLQQIASDIQARLGRSGGGAAGEHESTINQLEDAARRFEVSHPELTAVMARVINSLSDIGI